MLSCSRPRSPHHLCCVSNLREDLLITLLPNFPCDRYQPRDIPNLFARGLCYGSFIGKMIAATIEVMKAQAPLALESID